MTQWFLEKALLGSPEQGLGLERGMVGRHGGDQWDPDLFGNPLERGGGGALLSSRFSFASVAAFFAQDPFHEGNGAPSPLFHACRLVNMKFLLAFHALRGAVLRKGPCYLY